MLQFGLKEPLNEEQLRDSAIRSTKSSTSSDEFDDRAREYNIRELSDADVN
jgi:hypothetical protein